MKLLEFLSGFAPSSVFVLQGKDEFLVDLALQHIRRNTLQGGLSEFNHQVVRCTKSTKPGPVLDALAELPMLASVRLLELRDADTLPAAVQAAAAPALALSAADPAVITVLTCSSAPKKEAALFKLGQTVMCEVPEAERGGWLRDRLARWKLKLEPGAVEEILARVGGELRLLENHLEKLRAFAGDRPVTRAEIFEMVPMAASVQLWKLSAAVAAGNVAEAIAILDRIMETEDTPIGLLSYLNTYLLSIAQTQHARGDLRALAQAFPQKKDFQLKKMVQEASTWSTKELAVAFESLLRADLRLKTGSDPRLVMQMLLMQFCSRSGARSRSPRSNMVVR